MYILWNINNDYFDYKKKRISNLKIESIFIKMIDDTIFLSDDLQFLLDLTRIRSFLFDSTVFLISSLTYS